MDGSESNFITETGMNHLNLIDDGSKEEYPINPDFFFPSCIPSEDCSSTIQCVCKDHIVPCDLVFHFHSSADFLSFKHIVIESGEHLQIIRPIEFVHNILQIYPTEFPHINELLIDLIVSFYYLFSGNESIITRLHSFCISNFKSNPEVTEILLQMARCEKSIEIKQFLWKHIHKLDSTSFINLSLLLLHEPTCLPPKRFRTINRLSSIINPLIFRVFSRLNLEDDPDEMGVILPLIRNCLLLPLVDDFNLFDDDFSPSFQQKFYHENPQKIEHSQNSIQAENSQAFENIENIQISEISEIDETESHEQNPEIERVRDMSRECNEFKEMTENERIEMEIEAIYFLKTRKTLPEDIIIRIGQLIEEGTLKERKAAIEFFCDWESFENLSDDFFLFKEKYVNILWEIFNSDTQNYINSLNSLKLILRIAQKTGINQPEDETLENLQEISFGENQELALIASQILALGE